MRNLSELSERDIVALAISSEEEDARVYADFADILRNDYPASSRIFADMAAEENEHRQWLIALHQEKFGEHIRLIRRNDVRGFAPRRSVWRRGPVRLDSMRRQAAMMELENGRFYQRAAARASDASVRRLLGDLAAAEMEHGNIADRLVEQNLPHAVRGEEDEVARRSLLLRVIQPGLVGLMDGSVSTLAPVFAAAFATHSSWQAFLVGLAATLGAGISMGFAEALSDNGSLTGRGAPLARGVICGLMTMLGGIGHALPFLLHDFRTAMAVAVCVVVIELAAISWIRWRFMDTPPLAATLQVAFGGALVFATGVLIGQG